MDQNQGNNTCMRKIHLPFQKLLKRFASHSVEYFGNVRLQQDKNKKLGKMRKITFIPASF